MTTNSRHKSLAVLGICIAACLFSVDISIVNTALPAIQKGLSTNLIALRWIIALFSIVLCSLLIIMGKLNDLIDPIKLLYSAMILFCIASLAAGLAPSIGWLIAARGLQGLAMAALFPGSLFIITHLFTHEKKSKATSLWSGSSSIGLALGPALGGFIIAITSWRWIFLINIPVTLLALAVCAPYLRKTLPKQPKQPIKIDWLGLLLTTLGISCLITSLLQEPVWGWSSPLTISLFLFGLAALFALYFFEQRVASPIIHFELLRNRLFLAATLGSALAGFFFYSCFFIFPLYIDKILNSNPMQLGLLLLPITLCMTIASYSMAYFTKHFAPRTLMVIGIAGLILVTLSWTTLSSHQSLTWLITSFIFFGLFWGMMYSSCSSFGLSVIPKERTGVASAMLIAMRNLTGTIGVSTSGLVFHYGFVAHLSNKTLPAKQVAFIHGLHAIAWLLFAVTACVLASTTYLITRTRMSDNKA